MPTLVLTRRIVAASTVEKMGKSSAFQLKALPLISIFQAYEGRLSSSPQVQWSLQEL